jgi:hypothetical protein
MAETLSSPLPATVPDTDSAPKRTRSTDNQQPEETSLPASPLSQAPCPSPASPEPVSDPDAHVDEDEDEDEDKDKDKDKDAEETAVLRAVCAALIAAVPHLPTTRGKGWQGALFTRFLEYLLPLVYGWHHAPNQPNRAHLIANVFSRYNSFANNPVQCRIPQFKDYFVQDDGNVEHFPEVTVFTRYCLRSDLYKIYQDLFILEHNDAPLTAEQCVNYVLRKTSILHQIANTATVSTKVAALAEEVRNKRWTKVRPAEHAEDAEDAEDTVDTVDL